MSDSQGPGGGALEPHPYGGGFGPPPHTPKLPYSPPTTSSASSGISSSSPNGLTDLSSSSSSQNNHQQQQQQHHHNNVHGNSHHNHHPHHLTLLKSSSSNNHNNSLGLHPPSWLPVTEEGARLSDAFSEMRYLELNNWDLSSGYPTAEGLTARLVDTRSITDSPDQPINYRPWEKPDNSNNQQQQQQQQPNNNNSSTPVTSSPSASSGTVTNTTNTITNGPSSRTTSSTPNGGAGGGVSSTNSDVENKSPPTLTPLTNAFPTFSDTFVPNGGGGQNKLPSFQSQFNSFTDSPIPGHLAAAAGHHHVVTESPTLPSFHTLPANTRGYVPTHAPGQLHPVGAHPGHPHMVAASPMGGGPRDQQPFLEERHIQLFPGQVPLGPGQFSQLIASSGGVGTPTMTITNGHHIHSPHGYHPVMNGGGGSSSNAGGSFGGAVVGTTSVMTPGTTTTLQLQELVPVPPMHTILHPSSAAAAAVAAVANSSSTHKLAQQITTDGSIPGLNLNIIDPHHPHHHSHAQQLHHHHHQFATPNGNNHLSLALPKYLAAAAAGGGPTNDGPIEAHLITVKLQNASYEHMAAQQTHHHAHHPGMLVQQQQHPQSLHPPPPPPHSNNTPTMQHHGGHPITKLEHHQRSPQIISNGTNGGGPNNNNTTTTTTTPSTPKRQGKRKRNENGHNNHHNHHHHMDSNNAHQVSSVSSTDSDFKRPNLGMNHHGTNGKGINGNGHSNGTGLGGDGVDPGLEKPVKKKRKRCGECIGCQRKDNCGECAPCRNDKSHQICKQRRCDKLTEKKERKPRDPLLRSNGEGRPGSNHHTTSNTRGSKMDGRGRQGSASSSGISASGPLGSMMPGYGYPGTDLNAPPGQGFAPRDRFWTNSGNNPDPWSAPGHGYAPPLELPPFGATTSPSGGSQTSSHSGYNSLSNIPSHSPYGNTPLPGQQNGGGSSGSEMSFPGPSPPNPVQPVPLAASPYPPPPSSISPRRQYTPSTTPSPHVGSHGGHSQQQQSPPNVNGLNGNGLNGNSNHSSGSSNTGSPPNSNNNNNNNNNNTASGAFESYLNGEHQNGIENGHGHGRHGQGMLMGKSGPNGPTGHPNEVPGYLPHPRQGLHNSSRYPGDMKASDGDPNMMPPYHQPHHQQSQQQMQQYYPQQGGYGGYGSPYPPYPDPNYHQPPPPPPHQQSQQHRRPFDPYQPYHQNPYGTESQSYLSHHHPSSDYSSDPSGGNGVKLELLDGGSSGGGPSRKSMDSSMSLDSLGGGGNKSSGNYGISSSDSSGGSSNNPPSNNNPSGDGSLMSLSQSVDNSSPHGFDLHFPMPPPPSSVKPEEPNNNEKQGETFLALGHPQSPSASQTTGSPKEGLEKSKRYGSSSSNTTTTTSSNRDSSNTTSSPSRSEGGDRNNESHPINIIPNEPPPKSPKYASTAGSGNNPTPAKKKRKKNKNKQESSGSGGGGGGDAKEKLHIKSEQPVKIKEEPKDSSETFHKIKIEEEDNSDNEEMGEDGEDNIKKEKKDVPMVECGCFPADEVHAEPGPFYTQLGAAHSLSELREQIENRTGFRGGQIRFEKVIYTGKEGKTSHGCPLAKWIIRRGSYEEQLLFLVKHRKGHKCSTAWIVICCVIWEGVPPHFSDNIYDTLVYKLNRFGIPTTRRSDTNEQRSCACQGVDPDTCGAAYSFGCAWSMFFNGCKYARSRNVRKFRLTEEHEESEMEEKLQHLATHLGPLYERVAPESFRNQVDHENEGLECRLGYRPGRPFSGVTVCMDYCSHAHKDAHNMTNGCTVTVSFTRNRTLSKGDDEQYHVFPLYKLDDTDEHGSKDGQKQKVKKGQLEILKKFPCKVRIRKVPLLPSRRRGKTKPPSSSSSSSSTKGSGGGGASSEASSSAATGLSSGSSKGAAGEFSDPPPAKKEKVSSLFNDHLTNGTGAGSDPFGAESRFHPSPYPGAPPPPHHSPFNAESPSGGPTLWNHFGASGSQPGASGSQSGGSGPGSNASSSSPFRSYFDHSFSSSATGSSSSSGFGTGSGSSSSLSSLTELTNSTSGSRHGSSSGSLNGPSSGSLLSAGSPRDAPSSGSSGYTSMSPILPSFRHTFMTEGESMMSSMSSPGAATSPPDSTSSPRSAAPPSSQHGYHHSSSGGGGGGSSKSSSHGNPQSSASSSSGTSTSNAMPPSAFGALTDHSSVYSSSFQPSQSGYPPGPGGAATSTSIGPPGGLYHPHPHNPCLPPSGLGGVPFSTSSMLGSASYGQPGASTFGAAPPEPHFGMNPLNSWSPMAPSYTSNYASPYAGYHPQSMGSMGGMGMGMGPSPNFGHHPMSMNQYPSYPIHNQQPQLQSQWGSAPPLNPFAPPSMNMNLNMAPHPVHHPPPPPSCFVTPPKPKVIPEVNESFSDNEEAFKDSQIGGVAIALTHGSVILQCAKHELHATTALKSPNRLYPSRICLIFYQHKSMNNRFHGWSEWEKKIEAKKLQEVKLINQGKMEASPRKMKQLIKEGYLQDSA